MLGGPGCKRELSSTETVATGALAGAIASILTTPADVMKTRIMTLPAGQSFQIGKMVIDIAQREGFAAFFKGAVPRMFWIAPLGAMNFAGYELAKNVSADVGGLSDTPPPPPLSPSGETSSHPLHTLFIPIHVHSITCRPTSLHCQATITEYGDCLGVLPTVLMFQDVPLTHCRRVIGRGRARSGIHPCD